MVFRPPPREMIELLRSILLKLEDAAEAESGDLADLRRSILERISELETARKIESQRTEIPATHHKAA